MEAKVKKTRYGLRYAHTRPLPDFLQLERLACDLQDRANDFRRAADMIEEQLKYRNRVWMKSVRDRELGRDVRHFVADILRTEAGRTRDNTWGKAGDRTANRRMKNTMGYQLRTEELN